MREIIFRGKCIDDGEWAYGDYYSTDEMPQRGEVGHYIKISLNEEYRVIPETVGQYIGWKDQDGKGKEMFEGDIFKDWLGQLSVIVWKEFRWAFETINEPSFKYRANFHNIGEVIGNKYDNIELLEREYK